MLDRLRLCCPSAVARTVVLVGGLSLERRRQRGTGGALALQVLGLLANGAVRAEEVNGAGGAVVLCIT